MGRRSSVSACSGRDGDGAAWPAVISPNARKIDQWRLDVVSRRRTFTGTGAHSSIANAIRFFYVGAGGVTELPTKLSCEMSIAAAGGVQTSTGCSDMPSTPKTRRYRSISSGRPSALFGLSDSFTAGRPSASTTLQTSEIALRSPSAPAGTHPTKSLVRLVPQPNDRLTCPRSARATLRSSRRPSRRTIR